VPSTLYIYYLVCEATCFILKSQSSSHVCRIYTNNIIHFKTIPTSHVISHFHFSYYNL